MANMDYCRFRNTLEDLRDCYRNFDDFVNKEEAGARERMYKVCQQIVENFDIEDLVDNLDE